MRKEQFQDQKSEAHTKQAKRAEAMVMTFVAMVKGPGANAKCQNNHACLKSQVVNDIYAK
jgi:hypothetical protein